MIAAWIIARLKAMPQCPFATVAGAAALSRITSHDRAGCPAAYVYPKVKAGSENSRANEQLLQRVEADFGIVLIADNAQDGEAQIAEIEELEQAVTDLLLGEKPDGAEDVLEYVSGEMIQVRGSQCWFEITLGTAYYEEKK